MTKVGPIHISFCAHCYDPKDLLGKTITFPDLADSENSENLNSLNVENIFDAFRRAYPEPICDVEATFFYDPDTKKVTIVENQNPAKEAISRYIHKCRFSRFHDSPKCRKSNRIEGDILQGRGISLKKHSQKSPLHKEFFHKP